MFVSDPEKQMLLLRCCVFGSFDVGLYEALILIVLPAVDDCHLATGV